MSLKSIDSNETYPTEIIKDSCSGTLDEAIEAQNPVKKYSIEQRVNDDRIYQVKRISDLEFCYMKAFKENEFNLKVDIENFEVLLNKHLEAEN